VALNERRRQSIRLSPWVERHYHPPQGPRGPLP
jgi:hypothetical protein